MSQWINTRVVFDMTSGQILEQDGYVYDGPLALAVGADKQSLDAVFKEVYEEGVAEGVNNKNPLRDMIKTERVPFRGREVIRLAHTSRNVSPMFVGEDAAFADSGVQGYSRMFIDQRKLMARLRMTWEVMQDSTADEGAFISARKSEMQYLIDDMARRDEYALVSEGRGVLATLSGSATGAVFNLANPGNITNSNFGNRFLSTGMWIGAVDPNAGYLRTSVRKVTAVSTDGTNATFDTSTFTGWTAGDYLVQVANSGVTDITDTSYEHSWWGVMALVDDGTYRANYFGMDRTISPAYSSYVKASNGALSTDVIQRTSDIIDQKLNGKISNMICHHSTRRLIIQLTDADRRYMGASLLKPDPGTIAFKQGDIPFGDVPVRAIRDFPLDVLMFLDLSNAGFREYVSEPGKWVDEDGSVLWRVGTGTSGRDSFEAWYRMRKQYFLEYPAFCARLDGITGQSLVVVRAAGS